MAAEKSRSLFQEQPENNKQSGKELMDRVLNVLVLNERREVRELGALMSWLSLLVCNEVHPTEWYREQWCVQNLSFVMKPNALWDTGFNCWRTDMKVGWTMVFQIDGEYIILQQKLSLMFNFQVKLLNMSLEWERPIETNSSIFAGVSLSCFSSDIITDCCWLIRLRRTQTDSTTPLFSNISDEEAD